MYDSIQHTGWLWGAGSRSVGEDEGGKKETLLV